MAPPDTPSVGCRRPLGASVKPLRYVQYFLSHRQSAFLLVAIAATMDSLLIPLRSNAAWFANEAAQAALEARIKAAVVTHDELIFQDGRYAVTVWDTGRAERMLLPGAMPEEERQQIRYYKPGSSSEIRIRADGGEAWHPIIGGPTIEILEVDYVPILTSSDLRNADFVTLQSFTATDDAANAFKRQAARDRAVPELMRALGAKVFQEAPITEALYFDSGLAKQLSAPFMTDLRVADFIKAKNRHLARDFWTVDLRLPILDTTMGVVLPDFTDLPWDQVMRIRESGAGRDLRRHLAAAAQEIAETATEMRDPKDLVILIQKHYLHQLSALIRDENPTVRKALVNLAANLLPSVGTLVSTAADIAGIVAHKGSWVALIGRDA
jgi:hypothetical protein